MTKNYQESILTFMQMYGLIQEGIHYTWCIQSMQMFNSDYIIIIIITILNLQIVENIHGIQMCT